MGFGLLFIGFFFAVMMSLYEIFSIAMLVGYPMILVALRRLAPYHRRFHLLFYVSMLSIPFALYYAPFSLSKLGVTALQGLFAGTHVTVMQWAYLIFLCAFQLLLLYAIAGLADELSLFAIKAMAWRNFLLVGICYLLDCIGRMPILAAYEPYFALPVILCRVLTIFLNLWLIYQCYRQICPEEENALAFDLEPAEEQEEEET